MNTYAVLVTKKNGDVHQLYRTKLGLMTSASQTYSLELAAVGAALDTWIGPA